MKKAFGGRKGACDRCRKVRRLCTLTDAASGFRKEVCRQCFRDVERRLNSQGLGIKFIDFKRG